MWDGSLVGEQDSVTLPDAPYSSLQLDAVLAADAAGVLVWWKTVRAGVYRRPDGTFTWFYHVEGNQGGWYFYKDETLAGGDAVLAGLGASPTSRQVFTLRYAPASGVLTWGRKNRDDAEDNEVTALDGSIPRLNGIITGSVAS